MAQQTPVKARVSSTGERVLPSVLEQVRIGGTPAFLGQADLQPGQGDEQRERGTEPERQQHVVAFKVGRAGRVPCRPGAEPGWRVASSAALCCQKRWSRRSTTLSVIAQGTPSTSVYQQTRPPSASNGHQPWAVPLRQIQQPALQQGDQHDERTGLAGQRRVMRHGVLILGPVTMYCRFAPAKRVSGGDARISAMSAPATHLTRHLLIALPALSDPNFSRSVALICQHDDNGAMGVMINRPSEYTLGEVLGQMVNRNRRRRPARSAWSSAAARCIPSAVSWSTMARREFEPGPRRWPLPDHLARRTRSDGRRQWPGARCWSRWGAPAGVPASLNWRSARTAG